MVAQAAEHKRRPLVLLAFLSVGVCILAGLYVASEDIRNTVHVLGSNLLGTTTAQSPRVEVQVKVQANVAPLPKVEKADPARSQVAPAHTATHKVITTVRDKDNRTLQIIDEPIPEDCYPEQHADYDGYAVKWGLGNKVRSAAECCRQCKEYKPEGDVPHRCHIWVWCGDPSGVCWTMDIHAHTTGDCWLKYQASWDGEVDREKTNLKINHRHKFSDTFRAEHKTSPELVPWVAGLVKPPPATKSAAGAA